MGAFLCQRACCPGWSFIYTRKQNFLVLLILDQGFSTSHNYVPRGTFGYFWGCFKLLQLEGAETSLLKSSGTRVGMLLAFYIAEGPCQANTHSIRGLQGSMRVDLIYSLSSNSHQCYSLLPNLKEILLIHQHTSLWGWAMCPERR